MVEPVCLRAQGVIPVLAQKLQEVAKWAKRRTCTHSAPPPAVASQKVKTSKIKSVQFTAPKRQESEM